MVRPVLLWLTGLLSSFMLGGGLGLFLTSLGALPGKDLNIMFSFGFALMFACVRLWVLEARSLRKPAP